MPRGLLSSLARSLHLTILEKLTTNICTHTTANPRWQRLVFTVNTCTCRTVILSHPQWAFLKGHSVRTLMTTGIGILSQALDTLMQTSIRRTLSVAITALMKTSRHPHLDLTTMIITENRAPLSPHAFLLEAYFLPFSRRTRHPQFLQVTERAHAILVTTSTRLPETTRNVLALAVLPTARPLLALSDHSVPPAPILRLRNLSCIAAQTKGQLPRQAVV